MKKVQSLLLKEPHLFKYVVIVCGLGFLSSVFLMSVSKTWSFIFIGLFFLALNYLLVFLHVNPYYKGMFYTVFPILFTVVISWLLKEISWIDAFVEGIDARRGVLTYPIGLVVVVLTIRLSGVKPYFQHLEEQTAEEKINQ